MSALPAAVPAPRLRWSHDDGDWVMLVLDDVEGRMPAQPWKREEFSRVLVALERLADALTPAPITAMSIVDDLAENFRSWRVIAEDPVLAGRLDGWMRQHLPELVALEEDWTECRAGRDVAAR